MKRAFCTRAKIEFLNHCLCIAGLLLFCAMGTAEEIGIIDGGESLRNAGMASVVIGLELVKDIKNASDEQKKKVDSQEDVLADKIIKWRKAQEEHERDLTDKEAERIAEKATKEMDEARAKLKEDQAKLKAINAELKRRQEKLEETYQAARENFDTTVKLRAEDPDLPAPSRPKVKSENSTTPKSTLTMEEGESAGGVSREQIADRDQAPGSTPTKPTARDTATKPTPERTPAQKEQSELTARGAIDQNPIAKAAADKIEQLGKLRSQIEEIKGNGEGLTPRQKEAIAEKEATAKDIEERLVKPHLDNARKLADAKAAAEVSAKRQSGFKDGQEHENNQTAVREAQKAYDESLRRLGGERHQELTDAVRETNPTSSKTNSTTKGAGEQKVVEAAQKIPASHGTESGLYELKSQDQAFPTARGARIAEGGEYLLDSEGMRLLNAKTGKPIGSLVGYNEEIGRYIFKDERGNYLTYDTWNKRNDTVTSSKNLPKLSATGRPTSGVTTKWAEGYEPKTTGVAVARTPTAIKNTPTSNGSASLTSTSPVQSSWGNSPVCGSNQRVCRRAGLLR